MRKENHYNSREGREQGKKGKERELKERGEIDLFRFAIKGRFDGIHRLAHPINILLNLRERHLCGQLQRLQRLPKTLNFIHLLKSIHNKVKESDFVVGGRASIPQFSESGKLESFSISVSGFVIQEVTNLQDIFQSFLEGLRGVTFIQPLLDIADQVGSLLINFGELWGGNKKELLKKGGKKEREKKKGRKKKINKNLELKSHCIKLGLQLWDWKNSHEILFSRAQQLNIAGKRLDCFDFFSVGNIFDQRFNSLGCNNLKERVRKEN